MRVITVAGLKGGVGKTTTAVHLAHALHRQGRHVLLVDTDPQGSALSWSERAAFTLPTVGLPVRDVHRRLPTLAGGADVAVIDTPPGDLAIARSALLAADDVLLPLPPATIDLDRLAPTLEVLADVDALRPAPAAPRVLLTRVRAGTRSARAARVVLGELGLDVLVTEIPLREAYAAAFGGPVAGSTDYDRVAGEALGAVPA
jgi:chromosome partitioning protein